MIEIRHLRKEYDNVTPLKDVNMTINDGDVIAVIGPSGTGKSTLLRCINMLETPTSGEVIVDGQVINDGKCDLNEVRKKMGMVFQSFNLFGHLTVIENIMNPQITLLGRSRQEAYDKAMDLLDKVGFRTDRDQSCRHIAERRLAVGWQLHYVRQSPPPAIPKGRNREYLCSRSYPNKSPHYHL